MNLSTRRSMPAMTAPPTRLRDIVMSDHERRHAEHDRRTAEAIVDFLFDGIGGAVAKLRACFGASRQRVALR